MSQEQKDALEAYYKDEIGHSKGALSFAIVMTRKLKDTTFPASPDDFRTDQEGQVKGLGGGPVKKILKEYGITRILSSEGGRTSRGNMGKLRAYLDLLNELHSKQRLDLQAAEEFWVGKIKDYFDQTPLEFRLDPSKSLRSCVHALLDQASERQRQNSGTMYVGAVMQHLIGAKLSMITDEHFEHHGFSVADAPSNRAGDFLVGDTAVHVTTAPSNGLMHKVRDNLKAGLKPLVITTMDGIGGAHALAKEMELDQRIDVIEVEQFLAGNLFEWSKFRHTERQASVVELFTRYNAIVSEKETDPSLRIDFGDSD